MANHKLEENYKDKNDKVSPWRCSRCYKKWTNKPKGECGGKPFKKDAKKNEESGIPAIVLGGELARIQRKWANDPLKAQQVKAKYIKVPKEKIE